MNILVHWMIGNPAGEPVSYSSSSQLAGKAADTDDGAGRSSFGIFSPPTDAAAFDDLYRRISGRVRARNLLSSAYKQLRI